MIDVPVRASRLGVRLCLCFPAVDVEPECLQALHILLGPVLICGVLGNTEEYVPSPGHHALRDGVYFFPRSNKLLATLNVLAGTLKAHDSEPAVIGLHSTEEIEISHIRKPPVVGRKSAVIG